MSRIMPIVMPKWGLAMKEGTLNAWLVEEGASIHLGQAIMEVETDKITGVVEAGDAGLLRRKVAVPGQTLPVKALLGVMAGPEVSDADIDAFVDGYVVPIAAETEDGDAGAAYQFVAVDGIRVRYARRGSGAPVCCSFMASGATSTTGSSTSMRWPSSTRSWRWICRATASLTALCRARHSAIWRAS